MLKSLFIKPVVVKSEPRLACTLILAEDWKSKSRADYCEVRTRPIDVTEDGRVERGQTPPEVKKDTALHTARRPRKSLTIQERHQGWLGAGSELRTWDSTFK